MADDADDLLEKWLASGQELLKARKGSAREAQLEQRLAAIEARFEAQPEEEQRDALADLSKEERKLLADFRAGTLKLQTDEGEPEIEEVEPPEPRRKTRPGRKSGSVYQYYTDDDGRVHATDLPQVWSGEDEPDEVEIPDDEESEAA